MPVYKVVFEECKKDGKLTDIIEYVEADDLKKVADKMSIKAEAMDWELKQVRYVLHIVERIQPNIKF